jgi:hypothetical protein
MPVLQYFPARGRAEPVRLCYVIKGVEWSEQHVGKDITDMHTNKEAFPYGQARPHQLSHSRAAASRVRRIPCEPGSTFQL